MENKSILENNILIAKFMGFKRKANGEWHDSEKHYGGLNHIDLGFHHRWDWLMPVVEKIESLDHGTSIAGGKKGFAGVIHIPEEGLASCMGSNKTANTKLEAMYQAVVKFINWYNNQ